MIESTVAEPIRSVIRGLAREAAPRLLADAFDEAYGEARSVLRQLMVDSLLQETSALRDGQNGSGSRPEPCRDHTVAETSSVDAGVYVYGFARGDGESRANPNGVNGLPISTITHHQVAAIVSEMYGARAGWDGGGGGTGDLAAIGARAQEHERVLQTMLDRGPVIPVRFGTVYPSAKPSS
jgi:hypothetical protein